jgi:hypothetical protein
MALSAFDRRRSTTGEGASAAHMAASGFENALCIRRGVPEHLGDGQNVRASLDGWRDAEPPDRPLAS